MEDFSYAEMVSRLLNSVFSTCSYEKTKWQKLCILLLFKITFLPVGQKILLNVSFSAGFLSFALVISP